MLIDFWNTGTFNINISLQTLAEIFITALCDIPIFKVLSVILYYIHYRLYISLPLAQMARDLIYKSVFSKKQSIATD